MNCNGISIKNTCGTKQYATCVYYEQEVPEFSSLINDECITVEEVLVDLYAIIGEVKEQFDFSGLNSTCITYPTNPTLVQVLNTQDAKICDLETQIATLNGTIATMQQQITDLQNNICN